MDGIHLYGNEYIFWDIFISHRSLRVIKLLINFEGENIQILIEHSAAMKINYFTIKNVPANNLKKK